MPEVVFPLDSTRKFSDQRFVGHNRWHPDILADPPDDQARVAPG
jgi:formamidase